MKRNKLGKTGIDVPAVGIGTWRTFDSDVSRRPLVKAALSAGANLFDSSPMYGRSESNLAQSIRALRSEVLVATKVWSNDTELGRKQIDAAIQMFGTVDIYQVHNLVQTDAYLPVLQGLVEDGKVRAVGATHYQESAFDDLAAVMRSGRVDMIQIPYNPLRRSAERELLPLAESLGLGVLVMSPLQGGILDLKPSQLELSQLGVDTWPQAILKWIVSDSRVSCVLTASHLPGRVVENSKAGQLPYFNPAQREFVERIAGRK